MPVEMGVEARREGVTSSVRPSSPCVPHVIWPARIQMEVPPTFVVGKRARDVLTSNAEKVVGPDRQTADRSRRLRREQRAVHADVAPHEEIVARGASESAGQWRRRTTERPRPPFRWRAEYGQH